MASLNDSVVVVAVIPSSVSLNGRRDQWLVGPLGIESLVKVQQYRVLRIQLLVEGALEVAVRP